MSVFDDAASLARRLGPLGKLPAEGIGLYGQAFHAAERLVLGVLRSRLDAVDPDPPPGSGTAPAGSPRELMARLLESSLAQDAAASREDLHASVLRQLVPDEARIIAALADGPPSPLIHVHPRAGGDAILENASLIGRTAALTLPSQTPAYVAHLLALGLVEVGPEDPEANEGYEILMADREVRAALKAGELSKLPARTLRRTVMLSARGRELWESSRPVESS